MSEPYNTIISILIGVPLGILIGMDIMRWWDNTHHDEDDYT